MIAISNRRREFISLLGGAAAWPLGARAQQPERMRRIGALSGIAVDDPESQVRIAAFRGNASTIRLDRRAQCADRPSLGWGRSQQYSTTSGGTGRARTRRHSGYWRLGHGAIASGDPHRPIVFVIVPDPVGSGLVNRLSRPGGNVTGFMAYEYNLSGKWLELLKQTAPAVTQAAVLRDPALTAGIGLFAIIQSVASSLGVEVVPINVGNATEIERAIGAFARELEWRSDRDARAPGRRFIAN